MSAPGTLRLYYLATPVFAVVDAAFSAPVRVAALGDSGLRWGYYALAFACGLVLLRKPGWTAAVGMAESAANLFLLMLGVLLPIWRSLDLVAAGGEPAAPLDAVGLANLSVSATVFLVAFYTNQHRLRTGGTSRTGHGFEGRNGKMTNGTENT